MLDVGENRPGPDYLSRLNAEQRRAVLHGGGAPAGPLLVIAGAGSGKTRTLVHRVAHLVVEGADLRRANARPVGVGPVSQCGSKDDGRAGVFERGLPVPPDARGRKLVITPDRPPQRMDSALVKALARAHRWWLMLKSSSSAR